MSMLWGILLGILKWIGILLLAILGLLLVLLLIVLLVPIRYRVKGARSPGNGILTAEGKVSWLLSIFAVTFAYDREFSWKIKIFGIPLKLKKKDPAADEEEEIDLETELDALLPDPPAAEESAVPSERKPDKDLVLQAQEFSADSIEDPPDRYTEIKVPAELCDEEFAEETEEDTVEVQDTPTEKIPLSEKIRTVLQKIAAFFRSLPEKLRAVRNTIASIPEKIRNVKSQADTWIAFAKSEEVKALLRICKKQIGQILRHLLPTKLRVRGNYGFADPAATGQLTGILYMLPGRLQKGLKLQPHFDRECLDGEALIKGRIRLGSLLWPLIRIVVRPCAWKVYKRFKAITDPKPLNTKSTNSKSAKSTGSGKNGKSNTKKSKKDLHKGGK